MDVRSNSTRMYARVLSLVSLFMGLSDAARLLGLGGGSASPVTMIGASAFILLSVFALMRLFASVGLWLQMQWGAVILLLSLAAELLLYLAGSTWITLTLWGFIFKLAIMLATIAHLASGRIMALRQPAD